MQINVWALYLSAIICYDNISARETEDVAVNETWGNLIAQSRNTIRLITPEELSKHGTPEDAWIAIDDDVFDITTQLGEVTEFSIFKPYLGKRAASADFKDFNEDLMSKLKKYYMGAFMPSKQLNLVPGKLMKFRTGVPNKTKNKVTEGELKRHNTPDNAWVTIQNQVYDITAMLKSNPRKMEPYKRYLGKDATRVFEFMNGKERAEVLWSDHFVGDFLPLGMINMKYMTAPENPPKYHLITPEELGKHNKIDDAWIAIDNKVYNITNYIHDTQNESLIERIGKDGTEAFNKSVPNLGSRLLFRSLYLGPLSDIKESLDRVLFDSERMMMEAWQITNSFHIPSKPRDISKAELARHNTTTDAWIAYNGDVYNITEFMKLYPDDRVKNGLMPYLGGDGSRALKMAFQGSIWAPEKFLSNFRLGTLAEKEEFSQ